MKKNLVVITLALLLASCVRPEESGVKVIVGAKLGTLDYSVVVIAEGKFRAVGPQSSTPVPKGSEIIRGLGMTVEPLPGGTPIEAGRPADLSLRNNLTGNIDRIMQHGDWVK
jgi:hypothetical protein